MHEDLAFPRLIYRGDHDELGSGNVGETKRVDDQGALDEALKDGWRLTAKPAEKAAPAPKDKK